MLHSAALALLVACTSASSPPPVAPHAPLDPPADTGAQLGAFGVYHARPDVDPFPDAPSADGWGFSSGPGSASSHFMLIEVDHDQPAAPAAARHGGPAPRLCDGTRILYEHESVAGNPLPWHVRTVVATAAPVLGPADVASCRIVGRPDVVINLDSNQADSHDWPWVQLTWTPDGVAKVKAAVGSDAQARLMLALGDDVVDSWAPASAHDGLNQVELKIPQPDATTAWAYARRNPQLCPR
jgi:hypothetical protein